MKPGSRHDHIRTVAHKLGVILELWSCRHQLEQLVKAAQDGAELRLRACYAYLLAVLRYHEEQNYPLMTAEEVMIGATELLKQVKDQHDTIHFADIVAKAHGCIITNDSKTLKRVRELFIEALSHSDDEARARLESKHSVIEHQLEKTDDVDRREEIERTGCQNLLTAM
jgi:hypothetical protein